MKTIKQTADRFRGTHRGYEIEIEREIDEDDPESEPSTTHGLFYIRVATPGHLPDLYDGYAPLMVRNIEEAKKEAVRGACLDSLPRVRRPA